MRKYLTAAAADQVFSGKASKVLITVNTALTGTITLLDQDGASGGDTIAVITNPTVGSQFEYWDFKNGVRVTPSATCDVTVSVDTSRIK